LESSSNGILEYWKNGIMGKIFLIGYMWDPIFHHSVLPSFHLLTIPILKKGGRI
jgi:hypothetical protein